MIDGDDLAACLTVARVGGGAPGARGGDGPTEARFSAEAPDWWGGTRVFGGLLVAQGLSAAHQTVPEGMAVHSLHGYFLRATRPGSRVELAVHPLRDGRSFATRGVETVVDGRRVFTMTSSFHVPEPGDEYQLAMPDDVPDPDDVQRAPIPIPFDVRELGPTPRRPDGTYRSTRRVWVRALWPLPDDPMVHAVVLAYLSDMTGAAFRPHSLGTWGTHTDASLDHAVWFHRPARADEWVLFDLHALVNATGRSTVRGEMYSRDGALCVSMAQEILIRPLEHPLPERVPAWAAPPGDRASGGTVSGPPA